MKKSLLIATAGLCIALNIVLSRFLAFDPAPFVRIGLSFLAVALGSIICGPVVGGFAAAAGDVLGYALFPNGAYIPGITVSAFLSGLLLGLLLHGKKPSFARTLIACAITGFAVEGGLNSLWLYLAIPGYTAWAIFGPRVVVQLVLVPLQAALIYFAWRESCRIHVLGLGGAGAK